MKKILTCLVLALLMGGTSLFAQITTGEPYATKFRTGNRPVKGTLGFYFAPSVQDFKAILDKDIEYKGVPKMNLKAYTSKNAEFRLGLEFQGLKTSMDGFNDYGDVVKLEESNGINRVTPGFAYHFSNTNVLDVYMGADVTVGWDKWSSMTGIDGAKDFTNGYLQYSNSSFVYGAGLFFGLQTFIADLPLAVGIEWGISFLKHSNAQIETILYNGSDTYNYYSFYPKTLKDKDGNPIPNHKDIINGQETMMSLDAADMVTSLSAFHRLTNHDFRITFSYYFNSKK